MFRQAKLDTAAKSLSAAALAAMLSFSGSTMAAVLDAFGTAQGPAVDNAVDATEVTVVQGTRTIGANLTASSSGNGMQTNIGGGVFSFSLGADTAGTGRVTWQPGIANLSNSTAITVQVFNWGSVPGATLAVQLTDGSANTGTLSTTAVSPNSSVSFALNNAAFAGVNLSNIASTSIIISDLNNDGQELDATIDQVSTTDVVTTPTPSGIPVLPPLAIAIAVIGLGGVGVWSMRRRGSK